MFNKLIINKEKNLIVLSLSILIAFYPISFLLGSLIINLNTLLIGLIFLIASIKNKKLDLFKNEIFFLLIVFLLSLIINLFFSENPENGFSRVFGFVRFIFLIMAFQFFFRNENKNYYSFVFKTWMIIFLIVTFDLIFEYFYGFNSLGYKSYMPGRLSGFLDQELKIGHFYSSFFLIISAYLLIIYKKNYLFFSVLICFIIVSLLIGERANFIRVFFMSILFIFLFDRKFILNKLIVLFILVLTIVSFISLNENYNKRFWGQFLKPIIFGKVKTDKIEINKIFSIKEVINYTVYGANYDRAYRVFLDNKFFGVGIKNYRNESNKKKYENKELHFNKAAASTHPHQLHLEFLCETGLFGYSFFLIFIFYTLYLSIKGLIKNNNPILLATVLYFIFSLFPLLPSGSFFTSFGATLFWINYGLLAANLNKKNII